MSDSSTLMTSSSGLAERNWKPRRRLRSSPVSCSARSGCAALERALAALDQIALLLELRRAALLQILVESFEAPLGDAEIREDQLVFHRLRVARGIDRARGMCDRLVAKRANDVHEGVGVLVAGDIDERLRAARARARRCR